MGQQESDKRGAVLANSENQMGKIKKKQSKN